MRENYCGFPLADDIYFDTEMVSKVIVELKCGKAADIAGLTAEHLHYSHPMLSVILSKFFHLILRSHYIPNGFKHSYIVPIPKIKDCRTKAMSCDDFRGIAISPILSKVFEHCLLKHLQLFIASNDNQFGFKKGYGCSHAIYTVRRIVNRFVSRGNTINLCAIDLTKAFDKVNHHGLYIKLMKRHLPVQLLVLIENLFSGCCACIKWESCWSVDFVINFGVRQGSVLSPFLFAIYIDDIGNLCRPEHCLYTILYADDILLLAPSVTLLERLLHDCEYVLSWLDMAINFKKSFCLRIGQRHDMQCASISSFSGQVIPWTTEIRYLGVYIVCSRIFKCSLDISKRSFYRAANAIFGKIGRYASEDVILQLISSKCMPVLLYGLEACPLTKTVISSLDFVVNRFFMKLFKTSDINTVKQCQREFNFSIPSDILVTRGEKFVNRYRQCDNIFYICNMTIYVTTLFGHKK